jgi:hypothetical protein
LVQAHMTHNRKPASKWMYVCIYECKRIYVPLEDINVVCKQ